MKRDSGPRKTTNLSEPVRQRLNMYALAASAASVGVLASAQSAEAKIVYTNAQQHIGVNGNYAVDLNHDGVADFLIQQWPGGFVGYTVGALFAKAALGNAIQSGDAALRLGQEIGPSQRFVSTTRGYGETMVWAERTSTSKTQIAGPWANVVNRYLGLKFQIRGKTHYGWARLTVKVKGLLITADLTGYAYETIAGKSLKAGETGDATMSRLEATTGLKGWDDSNSTPMLKDFDFLGMLALGAGAIPFWRLP